jgi:predicted small metal-binding protein
MTGGELTFHYVVDCPCGKTLTGDDEDEIVEVTFAHLREAHPERADEYERDHVLFMARRLVK